MPHAASLPQPTAESRPVIAAVCFDEYGRQCLRQALRLAARRDRPAIALHILHETTRNLGFYRRQDDGEVLRPNADVAGDLLAAFSAEVIADEPDTSDVSLRQLVVPGVPAGRIVEVARLTDAELIVIGARPRTGLERLLSPDVIGSVLRHAGCPVLVVDALGEPVDPHDLRPGHPRQPLPPAAGAT